MCHVALLIVTVNGCIQLNSTHLPVWNYYISSIITLYVYFEACMIMLALVQLTLHHNL